MNDEYLFPDRLKTEMLNELSSYQDTKSKVITYWANIWSLLQKLVNHKFKGIPDRNRKDLLDKLVESNLISNELKEDIDHLAEIRHAYGHDNSIDVMSGKTKNTMRREIEKANFIRRHNIPEFNKKTIEEKVESLCDTIFNMLSIEYKKAINMELFDLAKTDIEDNTLKY